MSRRLLLLSAIALACATWPAAAAGASMSGGPLHGSGYTYKDPATGKYVPVVGPVWVLRLESTTGYRGDYSLDGAPFVEVALGTTTLRLDVPLLSVHTLQTRLLYPSGDVDLTGPELSYAVDNVGPRTTALKAVRVRQDGYARFRFRLKDDGAPTDLVTIKVRTLKGRAVEVLYRGEQDPSMKATFLRLKVAIPTGKYRWFVYASDRCGNKQALVGRNRLTVTR